MVVQLSHIIASLGNSTRVIAVCCVVACVASSPFLVRGQEKSVPTAPATGDSQPFDEGSRYQPTPIPDRVVLTWTGDPATTQTVTWRTDTSVTSPVAEVCLASHGPQPESPVTKVEASSEELKTNRSTARYHSVQFQDLEPSTRYMYRVGDGEHWSEWNHFTTASHDPEPFSFIYFGDAQNDIRSRWSRVIRTAYESMPKASFMIHAGDLINRPQNDEEWGAWFEAGGWIFRTMPSIATPGNHEYTIVKDGDTMVRGITPQWRPTFALPENGPESLPESCYYIDYQGARIISINSNEQHEIQAKWLDQVLSESQQRWLIVTMHHPIYSSTPSRDNPDLRETLQPVFDKHEVDIVLQGHDHTYARSRLMKGEQNVSTGRTARDGGGTLYVVSVSGPKMYDLGYRDFMARAAEDTQLFQLIHVDQDRLRYEARTANGTLYDAFDLVKRDGKPNELINRIPDIAERRRSDKKDESGK